MRRYQNGRLYWTVALGNAIARVFRAAAMRYEIVCADLERCPRCGELIDQAISGAECKRRAVDEELRRV